MKHTIKLTILTAITCIAAQAAPFMVGDNAELFLTGSALVSRDDNIYLDSSNEKSDTIFSFTPGLDLVYGKNSATTGNLFLREEFRRFSSYDVQNTELFSAGINSMYDSGVTKAGFNASYAEVAQNDNDIRSTGDIVRRDLTNVNARTEFGISEKTKLSLAGSYAKTDYAPASYSDSSIVTLPIDVYYESDPKLDWSLGYQYRSSDLSGTGLDSTDHFFNLGARGEFTPLLSGQVRLGYTQRSFDTIADQNLFGVDSNLTYLFSEKTSFRFNFSNDFGSSGTGDSTRNLTLGLSAISQMTDQWSLNAGISSRSIKYTSRKDDFVEAQVGVTYKYNNILSFNGSLINRNNSSGLASAEFSNTVFSFGASIRY